MKCITLVAAFVVLFGGSQAQNPQVTLPGLGTMEGYIGNSYITERPFNHFRGVPFASPPVGNLRFKAPEPVQPWDGVLDAHTTFGHRCLQQGPAGKSLDTWQSVVESMAFSRAEEESREDCLYLQVYSPNLDPSANLPVLVFFHGGAFTTGSSRLYGGNKFMEHDIVLVIPHYRLGPLGYLSLHTDEIAGNAGMLDQVEALQWVQNYISNFGGDPNRVTIMGESAGGVSTAMLNLSPLSTNLFHQYIAQSGSAMSDWGLDSDPIHSAIEIGKEAGCLDSEINALTECLMAADPMELTKAHTRFQIKELHEGRNGFGGSCPVVQLAGSKRFLERTPRDIYVSGEYNGKPGLFGANKHEGTMIYAFLHQHFLEYNDLVNNEEFMSRDITKVFMGFLGGRDQGDTIAIAVENTYFGKNNMGNLTAIVPGLIDFTSNMFIKGGMYSAAEFNAAKGSASYLYSFHYDGSRSLFPYIAPLAPIPGGICHGNEMILQFSIPTFTTDDQDKFISSQIVSLWANFVQYGDPTYNPVEGVPTWPAWTEEDGSYMVINNEFSVLQNYPENECFVSINENFPYA